MAVDTVQDMATGSADFAAFSGKRK